MYVKHDLGDMLNGSQGKKVGGVHLHHIGIHIQERQGPNQL